MTRNSLILYFHCRKSSTVTMNDSNGLTLFYDMLDEKEEKRKGEKKEEDK